MTALIVTWAALLVGCCPVVLEPPSFWTAIANNPAIDAVIRRHCVIELVDRHAHPGMKLADFARLFGKPNWLNETVISWNKVAMCGHIPVDIDSKSTTFSFRLFPELPGDVEAVYFRVAGQLDGETCLKLIRGQQSDCFTDAVVLEVVTSTGRRHAAETWEKAWKTTLRFKGRYLGSFVRKGMTQDEVERILGKDDRPLPTDGVIGGILFRSLHYTDLGLGVALIGDEKGVFRVDDISFQPITSPP
jgi:hypothetical protein